MEQTIDRQTKKQNKVGSSPVVQYAKGKTANISIASRYASGVLHVSNHRNLLTISGKSKTP